MQPVHETFYDMHKDMFCFIGSLSRRQNSECRTSHEMLDVLFAAYPEDRIVSGE